MKSCYYPWISSIKSIYTLQFIVWLSLLLAGCRSIEENKSVLKQIDELYYEKK